eukprot:TRINITY_DN6320_c0_g1_i1.p1 TRINITY_DN6320_c0_g1~~TRINITY_DN6320_c0_g1_i1.p1  ORF type:complete len:1456 (+),score=451.15 TRINITY_DN6320_c0_g1_i1:102-4469(+)
MGGQASKEEKVGLGCWFREDWENADYHHTPYRNADKSHFQKLYPQLWNTYEAIYGSPSPKTYTWSLLQDLQLLQTAETNRDMRDVAWAMNCFTRAELDSESRCIAELGRMLILMLPAREHEAWFHNLHETNRLEEVLRTHDSKKEVFNDVEKHAKSSVALGCIMEDLRIRFAKLQKWQRVAVYHAGCEGMVMEAQGIIDLFHKDAFTLSFAKQLIHSGNFKLALKIIKSTPVDKLCDTVQLQSDDKKYSYYELYTAFRMHGASAAADDLLRFFLANRVYSPEAISLFFRNSDLDDSLEFLIAFISLVRVMDVATFKAVVKETGNSKAVPEPTVPGASKAPLYLLNYLLESLADVGPERLEAMMHERDFQQAFETVFLLAEPSELAAHIKAGYGKSSQAESEACGKILVKCLEFWVRIHLLRILDLNRKEFRHTANNFFIVSGKQLWAWRRGNPGREHYFSTDTRTLDDMLAVLHSFLFTCPVLDFGLVGKLLSIAYRRVPAIHIFTEIIPAQSKLFDLVAIMFSRHMSDLLLQELKVLMIHPGFYDSRVQTLLGSIFTQKLREVFQEDMAYPRLLEVVVRLVGLEKDSTSKEETDLQKLLQEICKHCSGHPLCLKLMLALLDAAAEKPDHEFMPKSADGGGQSFTLNDLGLCSRQLRRACNSAKSEDAQSTLMRIVEAFAQTSPRGWSSLFSSLETVLFFLRLKEYEDLDLAYMKFMEINPKPFAENPEMKIMLDEARKFYGKAFVDASKMSAMELCSLDVRKALSKARLAAGAEGSLPAPPGQNGPIPPPGSMGGSVTAEDWNNIIEIATCAAESMQDKYNLPMLPHHTQIITVLMFASQVAGYVPKQGKDTKPKCVLGRVNTGEGKSWIIGMLASFIAKRGLKAHVVVDNATLLERDFAVMSALFEKLGLKACKRDLSGDHNIVYCSGMDIELYFMEQIQKGEAEVSFRNCALIADEVDSLIVDDNVFKCYVNNYDEGSDVCEWWYSFGHENPHATANAEGWKKRILERLEGAYVEMEQKIEGRDFAIDYNQGMVWALDERTAQVIRAAWFLWLELKRKSVREDYRMAYMTRQNVVCKTSCFSSYRFIFGLTGSLGTQAEQSYTQKHFGSSSFFVPPMLDTCRGKASSKAQCRFMIVEPDADQQLARTVHTVMEYIAYVPIVVVCRDIDRVAQVAAALRERLPYHAHGDDAGPGIVELLDCPGMEAEFQRGVDLATQPLDILDAETQQPRRFWRTAITTAVGARGQDYQISDDKVDECGGLMLCLEFVPHSEREWIQFLGRTARHDHQGQYAVILNQQEVDWALQGDAVQEDMVVQQILDKIQVETQQKLDEASAQIITGSIMHNCTRQWWQWSSKETGRTLDRTRWRNKFQKWVDLCEQFETMKPPEIVAKFKKMRVTDADEKGPNEPDSDEDVGGAPGAGGAPGQNQQQPGGAPGQQGLQDAANGAWFKLW